MGDCDLWRYSTREHFCGKHHCCCSEQNLVSRKVCLTVTVREVHPHQWAVTPDGSNSVLKAF